MNRAQIPMTFLGALLLVVATTLPLTAGDSGHDEPAKSSNIVETAATNSDFETLVKAVEAADLKEKLAGEGPYTLFAPTDAAFAALPKGTMESLLKPENKDKLTSILTYHVVAAEVPAKQAMKMTEGSTLNGEAVELSYKNDTLRVNSARVVESDIMASNGVIHVIDQVLLPAPSSKTGR